jgi:hypothetical protein
VVLLVAEFTGWSNTELMDMDLDELGTWWSELQALGKDRQAAQERALRQQQQKQQQRR